MALVIMNNYEKISWINELLNITSWANTFGNKVDWTSNNNASLKFDWTQALLSQYIDSPTINGLLESYSSAVDANADITNFYDNIWNVATAVGSGLDIWGVIVGVARYINTNEAGVYFGFEEAVSGTSGVQPFNQAPFYSGVSATGTYLLSDSQYRRLIMVKAAANISNNTIPSINALLRAEFGSPTVDNDPYGQAWVIDNNNMTMTYYLNFAPNSVQKAIITNSGVFPRPAGVQLLLTHL